MAIGANISYRNPKGIQDVSLRLLKQRPASQILPLKKWCKKAGVPATNTALDNPNALGDMCLDTTNNHVYVCTAYSTDASATTWTQVA